METFGNGVTSLEISGKIFQIMINQGIKAHGNKSSGIYLHKGAEVSLKKLKVICPKGTKILIEDGVFLNDSLDSLKTSSRNYISKNL